MNFFREMLTIFVFTRESPLFRQIVSAIKFCHRRKVINRVVKPEKIIMVREDFVKLADFGLCVFLGNSR